MADTEIGGKPLPTPQETPHGSNKDEAMLKLMKEIKEKIEQTNNMKTEVEKEPTAIVAKVYLQGTAYELTNTITSMLTPFKPKQSSEKSKVLAVTMLVEDLSPKSK